MEGVTAVTQRITGWGQSPRGIGTLIAVLVRYPELSSLYFGPEDGVLTLGFCIRTPVKVRQFQSLQKRLKDTLEAYRGMIKVPRMTTFTLTQDSMDPVTVLSWSRDVDSLTVEEVGVAIELLRETFGNDLVADPNDLVEEELLAQEETIQATLESLQQSPGGRLLALREEGRVLVFNT